MLIFRKKRIIVKASSNDIINALNKLAHKPTLFNSFNKDSFSFTMWEKHEYGRMYGAIRFFGNIENCGGESIVNYSILPGAASLIGLLVFFSAFVYAIILLLFSTGSIIFFALSAILVFIIVISIMSEETVCDERLIRKMHELEIEE